MYAPNNDLHVTIFGKQGAEKWVRHAYNIPPHVECWQPYRVFVTSHGGTLVHNAFYTVKEFRRWLGCRKLTLLPHHADGLSKRSWVARFGRIA